MCMQATKIGQLLENQQAGQQKSHSVLSCSSTTQTARDCTSSSKRHTPNPLRKGSSVSTPSVFEKSHSLPQLMRSRPFPATKRSYSSCTISHTLSHQQLQLSPVMQRRVSSESPVDDDDCKPCRPKANTLFSKHSAAKSFKKVVNSPPPIPTRQTCGDIKSKIASLEEDIALMQVQVRLYICTYSCVYDIPHQCVGFYLYNEPLGIPLPPGLPLPTSASKRSACAYYICTLHLCS